MNIKNIEFKAKVKDIDTLEQQLKTLSPVYKGLAVELLNGEKFLIGTQKETELKKVLKNVSMEYGKPAD